MASEANSAGVAEAIRDTLDLFLADHPGLLDVDVGLGALAPTRVERKLYERLSHDAPAFALIIGGKAFEVTVKEAAHA
jgi:hypothetical protein